MTKRFSLGKYLLWIEKDYDAECLRLAKDSIRKGTHYACKLDGRPVSSILKEGWAMMDEWVIETK